MQDLAIIGATFYCLVAIIISLLVVYVAGYGFCLFWHLHGYRPRLINNEETKFCAGVISLETTLLLLLYASTVYVSVMLDMSNQFSLYENLYIVWPQLLARSAGYAFLLGVGILCTIGLFLGVARGLDRVSERVSSQKGQPYEVASLARGDVKG